MSDGQKQRDRDSIFADKRIAELQKIRASVTSHYAVFSPETAAVILQHLDTAQREFDALKAAEGAVFRAGMALHEVEKIIRGDQQKPQFQQNPLPVMLQMAMADIQRAIDR